MAAKDLGTRFTCFKCQTKFYDLKKPDPICPKCGADQRESPANKRAESRRGRLSAARAAAPVEPVVEESSDLLAGDDDEEFEDEDVAGDDDDA